MPGEAILLHGGQGGVNALALRWRDETTQHLHERWILRPGQNVLGVSHLLHEAFLGVRSVLLLAER